MQRSESTPEQDDNMGTAELSFQHLSCTDGGPVRYPSVKKVADYALGLLRGMTNIDESEQLSNVDPQSGDEADMTCLLSAV